MARRLRLLDIKWQVKSYCCNFIANSPNISASICLFSHSHSGGGWRENQVYWRFAYWRVAMRPRSSIVSRSIRPASQAAISGRSEEHTSELQSLMRISYAVFCLKKKKSTQKQE